MSNSNSNDEAISVRLSYFLFYFLDDDDDDDSIIS